MMKNRNSIYVLIISALLIVGMSGCAKSGGENNQSSADTNVTSQAVNENQSRDESSFDAVSETESSTTVSSEDSTESSADEKTSTDDHQKEESEGESSIENSDGYIFDDEQIVTHYHDAKTFTDNDDYNSLFSKNPLDKAYNDEMKKLDAVTEMRKTTIEYGNLWKEEVQKAYQKLHEVLKDRPEEQKKLEDSQQDWEATLPEVQSSFMEETAEQGTFGMLAFDTSVMNYYKGRAAVLYYQIYILNGSFVME